MVPGFGVWAECQSIGTSGKNQRACYLAPTNSPLVHILSFRSQGVVFIFIFPTGLTALDSEPRGRRYAKNTGHDRNHLYSRAIHCPASMEMHYVQWFLLKSMYEITDCAKNQIFPSRVWADQEVEGLLFSPQNSQLVHILSFHSQAVVSFSSFQQVRQPSIPSPVEEDMSKIWDTTGTVFIQWPSILLLVWRSIM